MASCSSSALRSLSRASRSTWSSDVDRRPRAGAPSCVTTRRTSPPWTCSLFRALASTCSMPLSSFGWPAETLSGSTSQPIRPRTGSHARSPKHKDGEVPAKPAAARKRQINRGALPVHLPREEIVIDVEDKTCACCGGLKHRIGEDVSERLDVIPAQLKVIVTRRPKYACRACAGEVTQAPAPERLIESGIPTEALIAHVLVAKYADHTPLYRQAQIYARQGITLDRSTLADWVGRAAFALRSVHARLFELLKQSSKLFADETTAPVLDPGRGRTKKGQLWAYARDERPWAGPDPPGVAYAYAPDRKHVRPAEHLAGFSGKLQVDGYGAYAELAEGGNVELAFCWSHVRGTFMRSRLPRPRRSPARPSS